MWPRTNPNHAPMKSSMSSRTKVLSAIVIVLLVGGVAFLAANGNLLQGKFRPSPQIAAILQNFPNFKCNLNTSSITVSSVVVEVPSQVTTTIPSNLTSWVTSLVTSQVPQCVVPSKK